MHSGGIEHSHRRFTADRRKICEELVHRRPSLKVVEKMFYRHPRASTAERPTHDLGVLAYEEWIHNYFQ